MDFAVRLLYVEPERKCLVRHAVIENFNSPFPPPYFCIACHNFTKNPSRPSRAWRTLWMAPKLLTCCFEVRDRDTFTPKRTVTNVWYTPLKSRVGMHTSMIYCYTVYRFYRRLALGDIATIVNNQVLRNIHIGCGKY